VRQLFTVLFWLKEPFRNIPFIRNKSRGRYVPKPCHPGLSGSFKMLLIASTQYGMDSGPAAVMPVTGDSGATVMLILSLTKGTRGAFYWS